MRKFLLYCLAAIAIGGATVQLSACNTITGVVNPTELGCTPDEANECRFVVAAALVESANVSIRESLQSGAITADEAARLRAITLKGEEALALAKEALPLENATTTERLLALNRIVIQLLREQVVKQGVR